MSDIGLHSAVAVAAALTDPAAVVDSSRESSVVPGAVGASAADRYLYSDPNLTDSVYDSIKTLKERIQKENLDYRIDSHKGFLRCEEHDCHFLLKIRYGSSKGHVILGRSKHNHSHPVIEREKSQRRIKMELLERYYDPEVVRSIKLKQVLKEIEQELGEPLVGQELKKFKNKVYNIRQKIRREGEDGVSSPSAAALAALKADPASAAADPSLALSLALTAALASLLLLGEFDDSPETEGSKKDSLGKKLNTDEIRNIIYESQKKDEPKKLPEKITEQNNLFLQQGIEDEDKTPEPKDVDVKADDDSKTDDAKDSTENPIKLPMPKKRKLSESEDDKPNSRFSQIIKRFI